MTICRIVGDVVSTHKNAHLQGHKLLLVQPVELDQKTPKGNSMIAIDRVNAGKGVLVLVNKEGSSARLIMGDDENTGQVVIVAVIDGIDVPNQD